MLLWVCFHAYAASSLAQESCWFVHRTRAFPPPILISPRFPSHSQVPRNTCTWFFWPEGQVLLRTYSGHCVIQFLMTGAAFWAKWWGGKKSENNNGVFFHTLWTTGHPSARFLWQERLVFSVLSHCGEVPDRGHSCVRGRRGKKAKKSMCGTLFSSWGPLSCSGQERSFLSEFWCLCLCAIP